MAEVERPIIRCRTKGRGALIRRLGGLVIAAHRYGRCRATTASERAWAARLIDRLQLALNEARAPSHAIGYVALVDEQRAETGSHHG